MRRFKSLFLLVSMLLMLSTCAAPAYASAGEGEQGLAAAPSQALTPEGNMVLVDDIKGEDKQFIVVQSRGGHYFYIILDHAGEGENTVHFLNQVDEADLLSLIEEEQAPAVCSCTRKCTIGAINTYCEVCAVNMSGCAGAEPEPEEPDTPPDSPDAPEGPEAPEEPGPPEIPGPPKEKGADPRMLAALLAVLGAGGAGACLKFFKKKPSARGSIDLDDCDYGDDEDLDDEPEDDLGDDGQEDE